MRHGRRNGTGTVFGLVCAAIIVVSGSGCMTYRGPQGVAATIEQKAGLELHREFGIKLGPISTRIAASIVHQGDGDLDLRDLSGIGVAVFEVSDKKGAGSQPLTAKDLGVAGWRPMLDTRSDGEQILILVKPNDHEIREMMLLSIDSDEVVVARLKGHLDRLIAKTLDAANRGGAHGAVAAIGVQPN